MNELTRRLIAEITKQKKSLESHKRAISKIVKWIDAAEDLIRKRLLPEGYVEIIISSYWVAPDGTPIGNYFIYAVPSDRVKDVPSNLSHDPETGANDSWLQLRDFPRYKWNSSLYTWYKPEDIGGSLGKDIDFLRLEFDG